jgi:hypothetical protein
VIEKLSDDERIYRTAIEQRLDPARAVNAYRRVQAIADAEHRAGVRRQLCGVILPAEDDDGDLTALVGRTKGEQFDAAQRESEAWVENYYTKTAPAFMAAHLLFGVEPTFRQIAAKAMAVYDNFFYEDSEGNLGEGITHTGDDDEWNFDSIAGPDVPIIITTSRPGHRYAIRNGMTFERVLNLVKKDAWCDIDFIGTGECNGMRANENDKNAYLYDYVPTRPTVVPFVNGNVVILARVCGQCWHLFTKEHKIKTKKCKIFTPIVDGFGSL